MRPRAPQGRQEQGREQQRQRQRGANSADAGGGLCKLLRFIGGGSRGGGTAPKIHFTAEVACAFVHGGHAFVPISLARALVLRVLGVVQRKMGVYDERFTHLQQVLRGDPRCGRPGA